MMTPAARLMRFPYILNILLILGVAPFSPAQAQQPGDQVLVVYNTKVPESRDVAQYYAQKRHVPERQILGLPMPALETISRDEYVTLLQKPILEYVSEKELLTFHTDLMRATASKAGSVVHRVVDAKIRYLVLCYGVPLRIARDTNLVEEGESEVRPEMRRNEAAVDSELTLLPLSKTGYKLFGPLQNVAFASTNAPGIHPTNGVLIVARLDGPSPQIARGLVDKALAAERDGLWGRAYFDARGLSTNTPYYKGDEWIRAAAAICRNSGFETILDDKPELFPEDYPLSQVAFYAGWYEGHASGAFVRPEVEFMPGAIAYHLHSFSARSLRPLTENWAGPLLAKGATATMGSVDEPYLVGTPDLGVFFRRIFMGFTFGEAALASQGALSWQITVVGDPLYCPFGKSPMELQKELEARRSPMLAWSQLRAVNLNALTGSKPSELIALLERCPLTATNAVLLEKLGDLRAANGQLPLAAQAYQDALKHNPTPMQSLRLRAAESAALLKTGTNTLTGTPSQPGS